MIIIQRVKRLPNFFLFDNLMMIKSTRKTKMMMIGFWIKDTHLDFRSPFNPFLFYPISQWICADLCLKLAQASIQGKDGVLGFLMRCKRNETRNPIHSKSEAILTHCIDILFFDSYYYNLLISMSPLLIIIIRVPWVSLIIIVISLLLPPFDSCTMYVK